MRATPDDSSLPRHVLAVPPIPLTAGHLVTALAIPVLHLTVPGWASRVWSQMTSNTRVIVLDRPESICSYALKFTNRRMTFSFKCCR